MSELKPQKKYEKFLDEETRNLHRLQAVAAAAAAAAAAGGPSTKLKPPPVVGPKITISRFKFPPIEAS